MSQQWIFHPSTLPQSCSLLKDPCALCCTIILQCFPKALVFKGFLFSLWHWESGGVVGEVLGVWVLRKEVIGSEPLMGWVESIQGRVINVPPLIMTTVSSWPHLINSAHFPLNGTISLGAKPSTYEPLWNITDMTDHAGLFCMCWHWPLFRPSSQGRQVNLDCSQLQLLRPHLFFNLCFSLSGRVLPIHSYACLDCFLLVSWKNFSGILEDPFWLSKARRM